MTSSLPQGPVTIERLCRLARVSRAGYYRFWQASAPRQHDTAVRDTIQRLVLGNGRYHRGYRYITRQLRNEGLIVNHKRVLRLMREDNLLGLRRRPFVPLTTDARHPWPVVPNRARDMQLSGLDQLWVADITYIRLQQEFAYLAIILDAFSRRVIGWAMADHLGAGLAVAALTLALTARRPPWGSLVHHSDRGVQYACAEYTSLLDAHGIAASMSRVGNPTTMPRPSVSSGHSRPKRSTARGTAITATRRAISAPSSTRSTTASACTLRSTIKRRSRSRPSTGRGPSPPRLSPRWVFQACENLR